MGTSYYVHVGAYLEIKTSTIERTSWYKTCPLKHHKSLDPFCPTCGQKQDQENVTEYPSLYELLGDEFEDEIFQLWEKKGTILAAGNQRRLPDHHPQDQYFTAEITHDMIDTYLENFAKNYVAVIDMLREKAESVQIKFGVIHYAF